MSQAFLAALGPCLLTLACTSPALLQGTPANASTTPSKKHATDLTEWHKISYPSAPVHLRWMGNDPDGTRLIALDGWRVKQRGEQVEFAKQALLTPIFRSCRSGSGWAHLTRERNVYWSSGFLGELKYLGSAQTSELLECGPELVTLGNPLKLWTETGGQTLSWDSPVGWASFSDPRHGRALALPDRWLTTSDGGETFSPLTKAPLSVAASLAQLPQEHERLNEREVGILIRAWLSRALSSEAGRAVAGQALNDGTAFRIGSSEKHTWVLLHRPSGAIATTELSSSCSESGSWGQKLVFVCPAAEPLPGGVTLRVVYPQAGILPSPPRIPQGGLVGDQAGRYLFMQASKSRQDGQVRNRALMRFDGTAWQVYPSLAGTPVAVRHGWLLLDEPPRIVPVEHPDQGGLELGRQAPDDGVQDRVNVKEVAVLSERVVFVRRPLNDARPWVVERELPSGREIKATPLPYGAPTYNALPPQLSCETESCSIDDETAWTRLPAAQQPQILPTPDRQPDDDHAVAYSSGFQSQDYLCEAVSPVPRVREELLGLAQPTNPGDDQRIVHMPTVGGMLDLGYADSGATLSWHGLDRDGAFRVTTPESRAISALWPSLPRFTSQPALVVPVLVSRELVLLDEELDEKHRLLLVRRDGGVSVLVPPSTYTLVVVPLGDGRTLLRLDRHSYEDVWLLASDGRILEKRSIVAVAGITTYAALRGAVAGVAFLDGKGPLFFSLSPDAPGLPFALADDHVIGPCRNKPAADELRLFGDANPALNVTLAGFTAADRAPLFHRDSVQPSALASIAITPSKTCLRGVTLDAPVSAELFSGSPWLHGHAQGKTKSYKLTCRSQFGAP